MKERINKVKEFPQLRKDSYSGAVLQTDNSALVAYKKQRAHLRKIEEVTTEMENLKSDMADIKKSLEIIIKGMK